MTMSTRQVWFLILTVVGLSIGQVLFKLAAREMRPGDTLVQQVFLNPWLYVALLVYVVATVFWVALLRQVPLQLAYPFVAMAFFVVPLLGWLFLGESLRWQNFAGAGLILTGVCVTVAWP